MRITGGAFKGRTLKTVKAGIGGYRPATAKVRLAVFSMLQARGVDWPGTRIMDCFAGSGSLGIEALSRGAAGVLFLEKDKRAAGLIRENLSLLGIGPARARVAAADLFRFLDKGAGPDRFDLVFIDPPYGKDMLEPALRLVLDRGWLGPEGMVLAEIEAGLEPPDNPGPDCEIIVDRTYGQTRIVIWKKERPSTPGPSTP